MQIPDWTKAEEYPEPGRAGNARLAWEFLRRNEKYQEAWREYVAKLKASAARNANVLRLIESWDQSPEAERKLWAEFDEDGLSRAVSGELDDLEPWIRLAAEGDAKRVRSVPLSRHVAAPWGMEFMASPAWEFDFRRIRFLNEKTIVLPTSSGMRKLEQASASASPHKIPWDLSQTKWLILQVDLTMPLEVIEEMVRREIRRQRRIREKRGHIQPINSRAQSPAKLVEYLRILDARQSKATFSKIGEVLFPRQDNSSPGYGRDKRVKAEHRAACKLREEGYRLLPLLKDSVREKQSRKS